MAAVLVNGKFAQFGGRLMVQVSDMLLAQFADNFRAAAAATVDTAATATATATATVTAPAAPVPAPPVAREINGLAIAWSLLKGWFTGLFAKKA